MLPPLRSLLPSRSLPFPSNKMCIITPIPFFATLPLYPPPHPLSSHLRAQVTPPTHSYSYLPEASLTRCEESHLTRKTLLLSQRLRLGLVWRLCALPVMPHWNKRRCKSCVSSVSLLCSQRGRKGGRGREGGTNG